MKQSQLLQWTMTAITICLVLCSCYPYPITSPPPYYVDMSRQEENNYYAPAGVNTPLLTEKNDGSFAIGTSFTHKTNSGISLQAAYLPFKHVGLSASYFSYANRGWSDQSEFGIGYVNKFSDNLLFESYGGIGDGKMKNNHSTGYSNLKSNSYFLQPTIAVGNKKQTIQFAFVSRFNHVNLKVVDSTYNNDREPFVTYQLKSIAENPNHLFWEPGFILRAGWPNVLFQAGYQYSTEISGKSETQFVHSNFTMGLVFRFNTTKQKQQ